MTKPKISQEQKDAEARARSDRFDSIQKGLETRTADLARTFSSRRSLFSGKPTMAMSK